MRRRRKRSQPVAPHLDPRLRAARPGEPAYALEHAPGGTLPERFVALQENARPFIEDGTLVMGNQTYAAPKVVRYHGDPPNKVIIGNWSSVAMDAEFYIGGLHPTHWVSTFAIREMFDLPGAFGGQIPYGRGDIVVGSDCWITNHAIVLSGVTIGDGAVVGMRALVTRDIEPFAITAGIPAKVVGQRFSDEQIAALLRIRWWDWPTEQVLEHVDYLNGRPVDEFIERFDVTGER